MFTFSIFTDDYVGWNLAQCELRCPFKMHREYPQTQIIKPVNILLHSLNPKLWTKTNAKIKQYMVSRTVEYDNFLGFGK